MQPVIFLTIYRRYHEFVDTIANIKKLESEFSQKPIIIVIWADPEDDRRWLFQEYLDAGLIDILLIRDSTDVDGINRPTTKPELLNMQLALDYLKTWFDREKMYIIGGACDVIVRPGIYKWIDEEIKNYPAILFHWQNKIAIQYCWSTNFFVTRDLDIFPCVLQGYEHDTLESGWGKWLNETNKYFLKSHNSRELKFNHMHTSENLPEFERRGVSKLDVVSNKKSLWDNTKELFQWLRLW